MENSERYMQCLADLAPHSNRQPDENVLPMNNKAILEALLKDLRTQLEVMNANPILPGSVKSAVNTSFQIMEILVSEVRHDG